MDTTLAIQVATASLSEGLSDLQHTIYQSRTSNSIYIEFKCDFLGILTVRDHFSRAQSRDSLKWNVIVGYKGPRRKVNKQIHERFYFSEKECALCVKQIQHYYEVGLARQAQRSARRRKRAS